MSDDEAPASPRSPRGAREPEDFSIKETFQGFFHPCYLQKQGSLAPTWHKRWFVLGLKTKSLYYYDAEGGREKGVFPLAKETQVFPSTYCPRKDLQSAAFSIRTDKKIMHLCAESSQQKDLKMKELSLTLMHLFGDKPAERRPTGSTPAGEKPAEEDEERRKKAIQVKKNAPSQISNAKSTGAKELDLSNCSLSEFPREATEVQTATSLVVANNKLTQLPDIARMPKVEELDCSMNQLSALDLPLLSACKNLTALNLSNNLLWAVPFEIGALASLERLDLRKNKLTALPDSVDRLSKLEELYLGGNQGLKTVPKGVLSLVGLQTLDMSLCSLSTVPPGLSSFSRLLDLNLAKNELKELPPIGNLTRLSTLDLSSNAFEDIPIFLGKCGLVKLDVTGNPLKNAELKKEAAAGDSALINYLKMQLQFAASKVELAPKPPPKKELVYTLKLAKDHIGEMVLKLDELRRALMLAPSLQEAVPVAQVVRGLKPEIERIRAVVPPVEPTPAPVIYPTDEKLVALQKSAGAALKDIKNVMTNWLGTVEGTPVPSERFDGLVKQVRFCRATLGFKDEPP